MKWISPIAVSACLAMSLQAGPNASTPIPADSKSPFDFRGKPTADYPPYTALFQTKTYGELKEGLENFFKQWEKDKKPLEDFSSINLYFHCKDAMVRTCYLLGDIEAGDQHLVENNPAGHYLQELNRRDLEQAKLQRVAKRIQTIHAQMGLEDPFPKGPPNDVTELYVPLARITEATYSKREKEPEEELEDSDE